MTAVRWGRSDDGYVESKCGRYKIKPIWAGRVQPIWYQVEDTVPDGHGMATCGTQKECKTWVERQVNPPPPPDPRFPITVTEDML